jgi:F-type H+-transporting ATPase subunit delta
MNRVSFSIAERYAAAFFELVREKQELDVVADNMAWIVEILKGSEDLRNVISDPHVPDAKLRLIFKELFEDKLTKLTYRFLRFLLDKKRIAVLLPVCECFQARYLEASGILKAKLTSYQPLTERQIEAIGRKLRDHFYKKVEIETQLDPDLLGGFTVQIGDTIHDFSIQTQLKNFRDAVMAA